MISENCLEKNIQTSEKDGERIHFAYVLGAAQTGLLD